MFPTIGHFFSYLTGRQISLSIPSFGLFIVLSFFAAYRCFLTMMYERIQRFRPIPAGFPFLIRTAAASRHPLLPPVQPRRLMDKMLFWCAITGFAGAVFFGKLEQHFDPTQPLWSQLLKSNGLNYYGALLFGALTYLYIAARNGLAFPDAADIGSPGMMLAYGLGRLGCHFAGDGDWGIVNLHPLPSWLDWLPSWSWAYTYPHNILHQGVAIPGCNDPANYCTRLPDPVYPTPLYEAVICILLFFILWRLRKKIKIPGLLFGIYALLNGTERLLIELIRINPRYHFLGLQLTQAQFFALGWIAAGLFSIAWFSRKSSSPA